LRANWKNEGLVSLKSKRNAVGVAVSASPRTVSDELLGVKLKEQKEHPPDSVMFQSTISDADNDVVVLPSVVMVPLIPGVGDNDGLRV
jgi:hypothetical protein